MMQLRNVIRLDSMPIERASITQEGYLEDKPVLTCTGIFEYRNPDGSTRRELRLPTEVFSPESLASYRGKPIIITHDAGLIDKGNVADNQIGTILSEGYRAGNDVKADIIIHNTEEMKRRGLKELSLGYNLDLDETPGTWNGQHYDAIQRNIRINHLALVREARAGEQARLNVDSKDSDKEILKGGRVMKKTREAARADSILSDEELAKAIEEYKARRAAKEGNEDAQEEVIAEAVEEVPEEEIVAEEAEADAKEAPEEEVTEVEEVTEEVPTEEIPEEEEVDAAEEEEVIPEDVEGKIQYVKDRRNRRDAEGDPKNGKEAMYQIATQDEDIDLLFDIIDTLLAKQDFDAADEIQEEEAPAEEEFATDERDDIEEPDESEFNDEGELKEDAEEVEEPVAEEEIPEEKMDAEEEAKEEEIPIEEQEFDACDYEEEEEKREDSFFNMDSINEIVHNRIELGMMGRQLNLDGLEYMSERDAKTKIINAVRPSLRLDGKSDAYIDASYDCAVADIKARKEKSTEFQKKQMFNKDSAIETEKTDSSVSARERMINRQHNKR